MTPFKRALVFLRHPMKFRRPLRTPGEVTPPADTAVAFGASNQLHQLDHPAHKPTLQPPTDTDAKEVKENEGGEDDAKDVSVDAAVNVDMAVETHEDEDDSEDAHANSDIPYTLPLDLVRKTRIEMMIRHIYVALSDDDREIAALRTRQNTQFTRIIRITFDPPSEEFRPSAWTQEKLAASKDTPLELRLNCPNFARGLDEYHMVLTQKQLLEAWKFVIFALPYRNNVWLKEKREFPLTVEQCVNSRVLIVGPPDRSVDIMAILVGYLTALVDTRPSALLGSVKRLNLVHSQWKNYALDNVAPVVEKLKW